MTLASPRVSLTMAGFPRKVSTIAIAIGGLASFFILGSLLLFSYPIGSSFSGYFYGMEAPGHMGFPVSSDNQTVEGFRQGTEFKNVHKNPSSSSSLDSGGDSSSSSSVNENDGEGERKVSRTESPLDLESDRKPETSFTQEKDNKLLPISLDTTVSPNMTGESDVRSGETNLVGFSNVSMDGDILSSSSLPHDDSKTASEETECDLYRGSWFYDPLGPLYTNNSCPVLTQMQNCQGNGRPDKEYENWRWKPSQCELPRFDAKKFLELMRGKTLAFIGDSVARNQMESMMCLLWQAETPVNRGNRKMQRWYFKSSNVMIARIWSSWLVHQFSEPFDFAPEGVTKLKLDVPDERIMEAILKFDVVVLSSGHWFAKQSAYILNEEIVGGQLWWPDKSKPMKVNNVDAFGISVETILTAMATHPNYTGLTIVRTFSPDHYEGGAWNTGGSCTGKVEPLPLGKLVKNGFTEVMHEQQVKGFDRAVKKQTNGSKLRLMDITEVFGYRHDGHPGPYRSPDPNKITKRGPDGRPPPQDCLHWCMPGPVDTWNEIVLELIRRSSS
ncbi:PREDICTED: protein trichome birefringence-like 18 [Tarenaya hassleriana]|uniref:protein trichome birefringence-like 18 n=1 Tax=Tarenaya hassleriana TaxID=28532 RepID=UPI00053CA461|nr:PREDICTED: protein trichome birefringence-like 18 [Tarenaya hassleriana]